MALYIYRSTDASAPVLSGSAGALISVIDACLVNGYGSKASMGWSKAYSGTNLASYRAPSGNRLYLGVDDTGTTSARVRGFHAMSAAGVAIAFGTNPFPTDLQLNGGNYVHKSDTASAAARPWRLVSDGFIFYLFLDSTATGVQNSCLAFGQIPSYKATDNYSTIIIGHIAANNTAGNHFGTTNNVSGYVQGGHYLAQRYDGLSNSEPFGKIPMRGCANLIGMGYSLISSYWALAYPDPITGGMLLTPYYINESVAGYLLPLVLRGRLPGIWAPCHAVPLNNGGIITGAAGTDVAGRTFECVYMNNGAGAFNVLFETSDTWHDVHFR